MKNMGKAMLYASLLFFVLFGGMSIKAMTLTVGESSVCDDGTIKIPISTDDAHGIAGVTFAVDYDTDYLTLTEIESTFFDTFDPQVLEVYDQALLKNDVDTGSLISSRQIPGL